MKNSPEHIKGILTVFFTALLWSSGGLFIKLITLSPMQISFFRCFIAALVFLIIYKSKVLKLNPLALLNSFSYAIVLILFVYATKTTTAANAIFLQSTAPIYVLIFEPILTKTKYEKINVITISVCFIGMILFFIGELSPGDIKGNIAALLAGIAFAAFFLGMKKNEGKFGEASIFLGNLLVSLFCIPFIFELKSLDGSDLAMVSFLGVFQIAIPYALFNYGIQRIKAVEASIISLFEPVLNPIWVFLGYGEIPKFNAIVGGLIIITAVTIKTFISGLNQINAKKNLEFK